jgi:hypothetical protein
LPLPPPPPLVIPERHFFLTWRCRRGGRCQRSRGFTHGNTPSRLRSYREPSPIQTHRRSGIPTVATAARTCRTYMGPHHVRLATRRNRSATPELRRSTGHGRHIAPATTCENPQPTRKRQPRERWAPVVSPPAASGVASGGRCSSSGPTTSTRSLPSPTSLSAIFAVGRNSAPFEVPRTFENLLHSVAGPWRPGDIEWTCCLNWSIAFRISLAC